MQTNQAALAEAVFVAKVAYRELSHIIDDAQQTAPSVILYNDIIRLASGALRDKPKEQIDQLMTGINHHLMLRKQYSDLVKRLSFTTSPALAAASTLQEMPARHTDNMQLKFKRDSLEPTQVFVLLHITNPNEQHHSENVVLNVISQAHCERIEFPPLIDGSTQCLFEESSAKLQFLLDLDAEISIMP